MSASSVSLHPKAPRDLSLAPVAAGIDVNLQGLRDRSPKEILTALELESDRPMFKDRRDQRVEHVLQAAVRLVDMHGWKAEITHDACRLHLSGGSVSLDLGLGSAVMDYIQSGVTV